MVIISLGYYLKSNGVIRWLSQKGHSTHFLKCFNDYKRLYADAVFGKSKNKYNVYVDKNCNVGVKSVRIYLSIM